MPCGGMPNSCTPRRICLSLSTGKWQLIMRSSPYRIAEWFHLYSDVHWYVGPATIDPVRQVTQC